MDALDQGVDVGIAFGGLDRRQHQVFGQVAGEQAVTVFGGAKLGAQLAQQGAVLDQAHAHQVEFGRGDASGLDPVGDVGLDSFLAGDGGLQAFLQLAQNPVRVATTSE